LEITFVGIRISIKLSRERHDAPNLLVRHPVGHVNIYTPLTYISALLAYRRTQVFCCQAYYPRIGEKIA
jgi:hypothetical protein